MATNLPSQTIEDSAAGTKLFFDKYGEEPQEFGANAVTLTVSFFQRRGFDQDAAETVAMTLLRQAKIDGTAISTIIESLGQFKTIELSQLVGEILNNNRVATSLLGFRTSDVKPNQIRNISA